MMGEFDRAQVEYKRVLMLLEAPSANIYVRLANVSLAQDRLQEAQVFLEKALELDSDNIYAYRRLGNLYMRQDQPGQAVIYYRRLTELEPRLVRNYILLAESLLTSGHPETALQELETALSLAGDRPGNYLTLGRLAQKAEGWPLVIQIYEAALAQGISDVEIYLHLGDAYRMIGVEDMAMANYRQAIQLDPDNPEAQQKFKETGENP